MIGRYSLPTDDLLARLSPTITVVTGTEDPDYPISNWAFRKPSKPAKFLEGRVRILFDFGGAANVAAFALIYSNAEEGLPCAIEFGPTSGTAAGSENLIIPPWTEDGWSVNAWTPITNSPTYRYWLLDLGGGSPGNSEPLVIGRPYFSGALRDLGAVEGIEQDVRWGVNISEDFRVIEHQTELGVDAGVYPLGDKGRRFRGELALYDTTAASFISLARSAQGRVYPWLLIPDAAVNDACMVRFEDSRWDRTRETINANIFPFRVRELSRGLPWP